MAWKPTLSNAQQNHQGGRLHEWLSVSALLLLATFWRFYQVRPLVLPAWVDAVHHTLLVRILLEQGWLPTTWAPYLPQTPFYYHFGFHVTAALLARATGMTGLALGQAVLMTGQLWQVLLVLAIYWLARTLLIEHEPAFLAALLVTFVAEMPAFYASWGRYPLLAGATLLIFAMAAATTRRWPLLTLLIALTALTHYYALFLLILFLAISWLWHPRQRLPLWLSGTAAAVLVSPWLWRVWTLGHQWGGIATALDEDGNRARYLLGLLGPWHNYGLLLLAGIGYGLMLRALYQRADVARHWGPLSLWTFCLLFLLGPWAVQPFRSDHAALLLFIPAVLFAALALTAFKRPYYRWTILLLLVLWGMIATRNLIRPDTMLADAGDVAALHWLDSNTAPDAKFLIDGAPWFGLWRGIDGGWWITPLTGRATVLPPLAYAWSVPPIIANYTAPTAQLAALADTDPAQYCQALPLLMQTVAATYYYTDAVQPQACNMLRLVYQNASGVHLYQLLPLAP